MKNVTVHRKKFVDLLVLVLLVFVAVGSRPVAPNKLEKKYPPSQDEKYWFELKNDLIFSEEINLPGYSGKEFGKLEYPTIAIDSKKNVYIAYNYTSEDGREAIYLNSFNAPGVKFEKTTEKNPDRRYLKIEGALDWGTAVQASKLGGAEYRPRMAVTAEDRVWIVWSARRGSQWDIFARVYADGELEDELQITNNVTYDFRPVVMPTKTGQVWLVWERGTIEKHIQIVAKYFQDGHWSEEIPLEDRPGYAYRPAMIEALDGSIWFGWDHTTGHNTDIYINRFKSGRLQQPPIRVTSHPGIDIKTALAWYDRKLWIAWTTNRRDENGWGIIRYPMVRALDGKDWFEPVTPISEIDLKSTSESQSYEYPTLTFDPYGRLYLFNRHDHVFSGRFYEQGRWSQNWLLDHQSWGQRGLYVHTVWASENELWMARRDRQTIYMQKMVRERPRKREIRLKKYLPKSYPTELSHLEGDAQRGPTKQGDYQVYYGDLHVHTAYSDGSGSFDELYNLYKNIYRLDFLAITEHDALRLANNHFSPGEWAYLKALNEIYNRPGEFVTLNAYEWTHSTWSGLQDSTSKIGHKNVYFQGGEESPFFNHHGEIAYDAVTLFKTLHKHDGIAFPHHPPWGGVTWEDHDPDIQANYEIVSIHGANEYMGNLPIPHRGGMPGTFAQDGLAKGKIIGFVGASDSHGLYYHANEGWREDAYKGGWTGVLLNGPLTREHVWQALHERRNYATSGEKVYLEFAINGLPMGTRLTVHEPPVIIFEVRSHDLLYAYVLRNNKELFVSGKIGGDLTAYKGMRDETIAVGQNFYYLRVVFRNGTMAWSSPIWVNYEPE
jgi:hypothetical protein